MTNSDEQQRLKGIVAELFPTRIREHSVQTGLARLIVGASNADDAAVFQLSGAVDLVVSSDYVRGPKFALFELGYLSLEDLGYYLVVANLSDVAAMGAIPIGVLTVVRYPPDMTDEQFSRVLLGIQKATRDYNTENVGGDIGEAERLILSGTALGIVASGRALTRGGAEPDDYLYVTGTIGTAGAAAVYFPRRKSLERHLSKDLEDVLIEAWRRPRAQVELGNLLGSAGLASACLDTSDGLRGSLDALCEASGVGFEVDLDSLPIHTAVFSVADCLGIDPHSLALSASVDFQLAFTCSPDRSNDLEEAFSRGGHKLYKIGVATAARDILGFRNGTSRTLPGIPWRHQSGDFGDALLDELF